MRLAADSYRACRRITHSSGSNFCRAFSLLPDQQRRAMEAVYAFARIADDQSDAPTTNSSVAWNADAWRRWIDRIDAAPLSPLEANEIEALAPIRYAVHDTVERYRVPKEAFYLLIDGIDFDLSGKVEIQDWPQLRRYCEQVAGSMGLACVAIWKEARQESITPLQRKLAIDCGIAFQLTNILRDLVEDASRGRCYLPLADLQRCGLDHAAWFDAMARIAAGGSPEPNLQEKILRLLQLYYEKALGHYRLGSKLQSSLPNPGQRIFSLMFSTYLTLLLKLRKDPVAALSKRARLSAIEKIQLASSHVLTPLFQDYSAQNLLPNAAMESADNSGVDHELGPGMGATRSIANDSPVRVAVVGGGLAGIQASIDLARHGAQVTLFEAKSKLGGRAGSFWDGASSRSIDYCQHVGMNCCSALRRWIRFTGQENLWKECDELHFVSTSSRLVSIKPWPLPPPFHLGAILMKWPDLRWSDRISIAQGMLKLMRWKPPNNAEPIDALTWLQNARQSTRSIENFWSVILISALGELPNKASAMAMRKVLIDGFTRTRDASHLLIPSASLQHIISAQTQTTLDSLGVRLKLSTPVKRMLADKETQRVCLHFKDGTQETFDAAIACTTWRQASSLLELSQEDTAYVESIGSSPITGIHTWWDRAWMETPHAILIDSICQWVFAEPTLNGDPALDAKEVDSDGDGSTGAYYQIVISASRNLDSLSPDEIAARVEAELQARFVAARSAKLIRYKIVTDPHAVFSCTPSLDANRWNADHLRGERIYLAGDWTRTGWPATMEGALRSGIFAAQCLLNDANHPVRIDPEL